MASTFSRAQEVAVQHDKLVYKVIAGQELAVDMFYAENPPSDTHPAIAFSHGGVGLLGTPQSFAKLADDMLEKDT